MNWIRRDSKDSPIVKRMIHDATCAEDLIRVNQYAAKVDQFNEDGMISVTLLEYEGPSLEPGADRENSMKSIGRGKPSSRKNDSNIDGSF